ncbi:MAG: anti-sigma factor antagonist [Pseudomonadales bacterium]|nr:anti-sigma factor antagonist [Pseudomonadales bacterium]
MGKILLAHQDGVKVLKFVGDVRLTLGPAISAFVKQIGSNPELRAVVIDLTEAESIDSTALGLLAKISLRSQESLGALPTIVSSNDDITRILFSMGFENVFVIVNEASKEVGPLGELPTQMLSEDAMREQVLEAHRVLMSLNEKNQDMFRDLVEALENESVECRARAAR